MRLAYPTSRAYEFHGVDSPRPHQYECLNNLTTDLVSMAQPIQPMLSPSGKEHHRALLQLFFELMLHIDFYRFFSSMLSLIKPSFCFPQKKPFTRTEKQFQIWGCWTESAPSASFSTLPARDQGPWSIPWPAMSCSAEKTVAWSPFKREDRGDQPSHPNPPNITQ